MDLEDVLDEDPELNEALDFEEMMESPALFHPVPSKEEYEALELNAFKRYWDKVWDYFVKPKMGIAKDIYVLECQHDNRREWRMQRTLWTIATLEDVKRAFMKVWPGLNTLPAQGSYGNRYGVTCRGQDGKVYILYRMAK